MVEGRETETYEGAKEADADEDVAADGAEEPAGEDVHDERHDRERERLERGVHRVVPADLLVEQRDEVAQRVVARPARSRSSISISREWPWMVGGTYQARKTRATMGPIFVPGLVQRLMGMMTDRPRRSRYASHATNTPSMRRETMRRAMIHGVFHPCRTAVDSLDRVTRG